MKDYLEKYRELQLKTIGQIPTDKVLEIIDRFKQALGKGQQIFIFGNGGSAASASHFATDLGKGASDKTSKRFRCFSLNDNTCWTTAVGNDYSYADVFVRQLMNFARKDDIVFTMSVSGNSPNLVKAIEWCKNNGVYTIALTGSGGGKLSEIADKPVVIPEMHYGRVEDAHMTICHMIAFAFMENDELQEG